MESYVLDKNTLNFSNAQLKRMDRLRLLRRMVDRASVDREKYVVSGRYDLVGIADQVITTCEDEIDTLTPKISKIRAA